MTKIGLMTLGCLIIVFSTLINCQAEEIKSRYATISYEDPDLLLDFNDNLNIGYKLHQYIRKQDKQTAADEVKAKIDVIVEQVEIVLDMFPAKVEFNIVLVEDEEDIEKIHLEVYKRKRKLLGFFSPKMNTVYLSVDDTKLKVVAHEFGHVVVEKYFKVSPPVKMHELLAQFAAANVGR